MKALTIAFLPPLFLLAACAATTPQPETPTVTSGATSCALGVAGARATATDTETGVQVTVAVDNMSLNELRVRARDAAGLHGPDAHQGLGHDGKHGNGGKHGLMPLQLPPARAGADDVEGGVRIQITPIDAKDLDRLRTSVRGRIDMMNRPCD
ncbi:MAG: hypothetical protein U0235_34405 [Polyangiaceae bacterium]